MCIFKKPIVNPELQDPILDSSIGVSELYNVIQANISYLTPENIYLSDRTMFLCHYDDIALFLAQDQTNKFGYVAEDFDCDDFSYRLMGQFSIPKWGALCLGIVWTDKHALNCIIDTEKKLWFIEPQNDELMTRLKSWMGSRIRFIIM